MELEDVGTITVDLYFLGGAVTIAMQSRGQILDEEEIIVHEMNIDEDTGYLNLIVTKKQNTIN